MVSLILNVKTSENGTYFNGILFLIIYLTIVISPITHAILNTSFLKVAIIDDSYKWVSITENLLKKVNDCTVISITHNGFDFVNWCNNNKNLPEIALIDIEMPVMDGIQLTDYLTNKYPEIKIIAISSYGEKELVEEMIGCGAMGFVSKLFELGNLLNAISDIKKGLVYIDPVLHIKDINRIKLIESRKQNHAELNFTKKQRELMTLYTTSAKQQEIAKTLSVSQKTLENRVKQLSETLNVTSRQEFTLKCISKGLSRMARIFKPKN